MCASKLYRAFHRFGQAKFPDGGLALGSSQFSILPQLHQKTMLDSKGVKIDLKISNSSCQSKSVTHSVSPELIKLLHFSRLFCQNLISVGLIPTFMANEKKWFL